MEQTEQSDNNRVNLDEALAVVSLLSAASEQPEYADATFGVISLVGDGNKGDQISVIQSLLQRHVSPIKLERHRVLCGNAAHFQGDERDVIFISMVAAPKDSGPLPLQREGAGESFKKRLNVAASRARDQMWVVHSVNPETDLQSADLRRRLILHARDPEALTDQLVVQEAATESEFERQVLRRLVQAGYRVTPQWHVGAYRIDLVVESGGKRLAVECDGDRYHTLENLPEDMARQAILERLGWRFARIRGSEFFRDPERAMAPVFARLEQLEITPDGPELSQPAAAAPEELKEQIIRRAAELRHRWSVGQDDEPATLAATLPLSQGTVVTHSAQANQFASSAIQLAASSHQPSGNGLGPDEQSSRGEESGTAPARAGGLLPSPAVPGHPGREPNRAAPSASTSHERAHSADAFDLIAFLQKKGLRYMDFRHKRGALWIIGGKIELKPVMDELRSRGCVFIFSPNGGGATNYKPAWFHK